MTSGVTGGTGVKGARRPEVRLPPLEPWDGAELVPDGDYDGVEFRAPDLTGQDGAGARFLDCALARCALDGTRLRRARLLDTLLTAPRGVGTDLSGATLRDVELTDPRLGGTQLHGAVLERVVVRGGKIDCLNLRGARLRDVVFESCVLVEADFAGARLERVEFVDCALREADLTGATLKDVDLRGAAPLGIARGVERLSGAVIGPAQLLDLAPVLAAGLGIRVQG
ncbi:pentapeptide repeat-containing protein [Streptomyces sp. TG1A-8]|uniref:pentapeptide repeat-containing protein n=1 Tax=Streptomyces sp. TG1A-8 TaxID=3051385 RepID=UPI00265BD20E|nr:pentapeptide repeat-containing protein [Streptomyces sp. TG1A-8]MDO0927134.1 pentapeptide repeat-containing protein [Streptomyces sp. TG1A-8]